MHSNLLKIALVVALFISGSMTITHAKPVTLRKDNLAHIVKPNLPNQENKNEVAMPATGSISGVVKFAGTTPKNESFTPMKHDDACMKSIPLDRLVVGKNQGVENTLIFIKNPPAGSTANMKAPVITQKHCRYSPHILVAAKGSSLELINEDAVLHNCHGYNYAYNEAGLDRSTAFNIAQPIQGQKSSQELRKQGMIEIQCDAGHVWMTSWVWVTQNPYATVTNANGEFSFDGVPPGTYTVVLWHEGWKIKNKGAKGVDVRPEFSEPIGEEQQITVTADNTASVNFDIH